MPEFQTETLPRLARPEGVAPALRGHLAALARGLGDIAEVAPSAADFRRVQIHGNNAFYGLLLRVCALVHEALMPEPGGGRFRFRDVLADPQTMGRIFQDFVRNFFRLEQDVFVVKGESFPWPTDDQYGHGHALMPTMNTDTSLLSNTK